MYTYIIGLLVSFLIILLIGRGSIFRKPFKLISFLVIGTLIIYITVSIIKLKQLPTKIVLDKELELMDFKVVDSKIYYINDTIKVNGDSLIKIYVIEKDIFNKFTINPNEYFDTPKNITIKNGIKSLPIIINGKHQIIVKLKNNGDVKCLSENTIVNVGDYETYKLRRFKEIYVGDKWVDNLSLPNKFKYNILYVPENDTIINKTILSNYKTKNNDEKFFNQYNI